MGSHASAHTAPPRTPAQVTEDGLRTLSQGGVQFRIALWALGFLVLLGLVGFVIRAVGGAGDRAAWGYYAAMFAFLLSTAGSAPLVSIALRMAKGHWRRPLSRAAELFAVVGAFNVLWFIPMLWLVPSAKGRHTLWFDWPLAPQLWDMLAVAGLALCGLGVLYVGALPDLAAARDRAPATRARRKLWARLALGWKGTTRQWKLMKWGQASLGGMFFMLLIMVHSLIATDFAISLVPGWKDALFPAYHALSSLQAAIATVLVTLFLLRQVGGLREYVHVDQFWALSKLLLALSLLWFYFWWSGFIVMWYGRQPGEQNLLKLFMFGPYRPVFFLVFFFNFLVPVALLIWNRVRKSILGPTLVGMSILIGTFFDRIRIYVAAFSVEEAGHALEQVPLAHLPDVADILIMVGGLAAVPLLYLLASRLVPLLSIWEMKEGHRLSERRRFLQTEVTVLAKPD